MVSFWPFKADDSSAASFEKTLSQLSSRITKASAKNDGFRQHQRRYIVLWTLYTSFAYILIALILTLVTGVHKWGSAEYSAIAGGPVLIFGVRTALDTYYNYRLSNSQSHLNELYKQREATIEKLKAATKYNSTQQLLDKYGGTPGKRQSSPQPSKKRKSGGPQGNQSAPQGARTGFAPPPTANIPGRSPPSGPLTPDGKPLMPQSQPASMLQPPSGLDESSEEFAANAFTAPTRPSPLRQLSSQPSSQYATEGPRWYDRILDLVLGEDESQARNRIVLICKNCKLVNGQAPPGVRTLEEVGKWRCSSCQTSNGVDSEELKILQQISQAGPDSPSSPETPVSPDPGQAASSSDGEPDDQDSANGSEEGEQTASGAALTSPASSTRSKARQRKKA